MHIVVWRVSQCKQVPRHDWISGETLSAGDGGTSHGHKLVPLERVKVNRCSYGVSMSCFIAEGGLGETERGKSTAFA